jgi:hypothetical protein
MFQSKLKENAKTRLRDYITSASNLGISHMILFSATDKSNGLNLDHYDRQLYEISQIASWTNYNLQNSQLFLS